MSWFAMIFTQLSAVTLRALCNFAALAAIFTLLASLISACNNMPPWWRKRDLSTDLCWNLVPQLLYRFVQTLLLVVGMAACYGITTSDQIDRFFAEGYGPLAHLKFWQQVTLYLLGSDLILYVTHRLFHTAPLWRFHAVHHSSEHLEWISAARFHPVDQIFHGNMPDLIMPLLGVSPQVVAWIMPFNVITSALVHANLDWNFGPFRFLFASPIYHRWHHTSPTRGGSSNFAGTFPLIDLLLGTFHMPMGQRPDAYGVDDPHFPTSFFGQLRHPFRRRRNQDPE